MNPAALFTIVVDIATFVLWVLGTYIPSQVGLLVFVPIVTAFAFTVTVMFAGLRRADILIGLFFVSLVVLEFVATYGIANIHGVY